MRPRCPTCGEDYPLLLGRMGRLIWFRCRYCGLDFHRQALAGESYYDSVSDNQAKRLADEGWGAEGDTLAQLGSNP